MRMTAEPTELDDGAPQSGIAISASGVAHRFGGAIALRGVRFEARSHEVHALLGENGAGKSTLVKILTGGLIPDEGELEVGGVQVRIHSPHDAQRLGIGAVHQESSLLPHLTVAENVAAIEDRPPSFGPWVRRAQLYSVAQRRLTEAGVAVDPRRTVGQLSAAERKLVEIARVITRKPRVVILDEPTAALEAAETERLLGFMRALANQGAAVIFVTHRLAEVMQVADRITVLRDGALAGTVRRSEIDAKALVRMIAGRDVTTERNTDRSASDQCVLRLGNLELAPGRPPVNLEVHRGEIVAAVGLIGSGVDTVVERVAGARARGGTISWFGREISLRSRTAAARLGVGFVPADRRGAGVVELQSVATNIGLASLRAHSRFGIVRRRALRATSAKFRQRMHIRCQRMDDAVSTLSGGNQQKVVIARWLARKVPLLVLQEPTQGVDVGARHDIHVDLIDFARDGGAVLFSSSDLDEVLALAHRILVFRGNECVAVFDTSHRDVDRRDLTSAMTGLSHAQGAT
jgi:ribose transport system ATP-binding protein